MKPWVVLEKAVGQTPLECLETYRDTKPELAGIKMAYAGRLDPMASGQLLILLGEECKRQQDYHNLDKEYIFQVLFGTASDTGDVLGLLEMPPEKIDGGELADTRISAVLKDLVGEITLPYPRFSSKTVAGKPLFLRALTKTDTKIDIPNKTSTIYQLELLATELAPAETIYRYVTKKIEAITPVKEVSKELGADFRREAVRRDWLAWQKASLGREYRLATCRTIVSSGTYMRTLATVIARRLGTKGLAYSCLLYTSPSPRDRTRSRMPSSA